MVFRGDEEEEQKKKARDALIVESVMDYCTGKYQYNPSQLLNKLGGLGVDCTSAYQMVPYFPIYSAPSPEVHCFCLKAVVEALGLDEPQKALNLERKTAENLLGLCQIVRLHFMPVFYNGIPLVKDLAACITKIRGRWCITDLMNGNESVRFRTATAMDPRKNVAAVLQVLLATDGTVPPSLYFIGVKYLHYDKNRDVKLPEFRKKNGGEVVKADAIVGKVVEHCLDPKEKSVAWLLNEVDYEGLTATSFVPPYGLTRGYTRCVWLKTIVELLGINEPDDAFKMTWASCENILFLASCARLPYTSAFYNSFEDIPRLRECVVHPKDGSNWKLMDIFDPDDDDDDNCLFFRRHDTRRFRKDLVAVLQVIFYGVAKGAAEAEAEAKAKAHAAFLRRRSMASGC